MYSSIKLLHPALIESPHSFSYTAVSNWRYISITYVFSFSYDESTLIIVIRVALLVLMTEGRSKGCKGLASNLVANAVWRDTVVI